MATTTKAIATARWNDPLGAADGARLLVCRYRPRALPKADETWDEWHRELAPSVALHAAYWGKHGAPIDWSEYRRRYLREMEQQSEAIASLARRVAAGERLTLLCSSACIDESRCHRSLLRDLILQRVARARRSRRHPLGLRSATPSAGRRREGVRTWP